MSEANSSEGAMAAVAEAKTPTAEVQALFQAHHAQVFRTAYRVTGSASDAEDVLQTVFVRLLERRSGDAIADPASYLCQAAVNAALDALRTRQRMPHLSLESCAGYVRATGPEPDRLQRAVELREALRRALAELSPKAAEIFVLRHLEGYSYLQIARLVGASLSNVAVTLHRTCRQLRQQLRSFQGGLS